MKFLQRAYAFILGGVFVTSAILIWKFGIINTLLVKLDLSSNDCDRIRQNYSSLINEMEGLGSNSSSEMGDWFLGDGISLVNQGCLTYEARYKPYETPMFGNEYLHHCNRILNNGKRSTVFGIRISQTQYFSKDFELFLRSVIAEVGWRYGKDVVLLQYIMDHTRTSTTVPAEFQSLLIPHDSSDIIIQFPTESDNIKGPEGRGYPPIAFYGHMSGLWYMKTNPNYDYMWIIESDVRALGPWDTILKYIGSEEEFVTTFPIEHTHPDNPWTPTKFKPENQFNGLQVMFGMSRKYFLAAEKEITMGKNAFLEIFLPSVAKVNNLTASYAALPVFGFNGSSLPNYDVGKLPPWTIVRGMNARIFTYGGTFHCTGNSNAPMFYARWKEDKTFCSTNSVVHPIKL
jgi:hypothetical protein